jgi:outer membrane lipoprotein SlyB
MTTSIRLLAATAACLAAMALPAHAACVDCGSVIDLKTIKKEGEASGGGMVVGGIVGGVLGHQVGSGRGNTAATVVGAGAGAYAGNQIEKNKNATTTYQVVVKLDDGQTRYFNFAQPTGYQIGDKIKILDKKLVRQ